MFKDENLQKLYPDTAALIKDTFNFFYYGVLKSQRVKKIFLLSLLILISLCSNNSLADEIMLNGQASAWAVSNDEWRAGMRYIPELGISHRLAEGKNIDAEISLKATCSEDDTNMKLYRSWLRYATEQFEIRLGLQKINFGPARILRTLMWFDQVDARDPLELTDGVYALLGRYYFLNNANIWVWGLYGNDDLKGLEVYETDRDKVESGGRFEFPVTKGEMALTFNQRYVDPADWEEKMLSPLSDGLENRYAVDGSWDLGVGLWFEASAGEIKINGEESFWQELLTVGADYTLDLGPGIHLLGEHSVKSTGPKIDDQDNVSRISALSLDLSISMLDSLNAIGYYDWRENKTYTYLGWKRTYDNWLVNLSVFSSREDETGVYGGKGIQCMVTYYH